MTLSRRDVLRRGGGAVLGGALLAGFGPAVASAQDLQRQGFQRRGFQKQSPQRNVSPDLHLLRRTGWGVRAGDVEALQRVGFEAYLAAQLEPQALPDPLIDTFMAQNRVLRADLATLREAADRDYGRLMEQTLWARLYRAAYSERGLYERMVEFWTDHLNVPIPDLLVDKIIDDREVVRKHALGRFSDLLYASATSPAMLVYLDNASSRKESPNENYARELLELHTLGVDGGYTERDVKEVARAFTGWGLHEGVPGRFYFSPDEHDTGEKRVLGRTLPAGRGIEDGLEVLDLLAHHPSTARHLAFKLGRFFVEDRPPESFVASTAAVFSGSGGDLKAVLRHVFSTPEFWASAGKKYRRPLEQLVANLRALAPALTVSAAGRQHFVWALEPLGHQPYGWFPPDGYPNTAAAWRSAGGLLGRWNLAMVLPYASEDWLEGVTLDLEALLPQADTVGAWVERCALRLTGETLEPEAHAALTEFVAGTADPDVPLTPELRADKRAALAGLLLASPQFSWS